MYQFYYADKKQELFQKECKDNVKNHYEIKAVRPTMWEEHCLECAAPVCFDSCMYYQARSDGRCKRFDNGMYVFSDKKACCGQGVHIKFRKWANMMTIIYPGMLSEKKYEAFSEKNEKLGKLLKFIEKSKLPQGVRWQAIRTLEYLRRFCMKKINKKTADCPADAFVFHGYSYTDDTYKLIVEVYEEHTPVYKTALPIKPGENIYVIRDINEACSKLNNLVKIYPENNIEAEMDIFWCDFVQGKPLAQETPSQKVKCVVWDLDGTLWNETLIETDNPSDIKLKEGMAEIIEQLDSRGIIQSIASKNDSAQAMAVLERLGISEYFLYPQIHWNAKSESLKAIAKSLNIGIDSLAFVDDTPFERNQVSFVCPQVRIYGAEDISELLTFDEFDVPVTEESRNRRKMYKAEENRNRLLYDDKTDLVSFIRKSNMRIHIFTPETTEEKLRCYELVVRTNQLNMSGKKYSSTEFENIFIQQGRINFAFSCEDDFGDYGIVGYGQYSIDDDVVVFKEFAMSCRVAGKFVESALFYQLLTREDKAKGYFTIYKTKKNILLRNSLEAIGFLVSEEDNDKVKYEFSKNLLNSDLVNSI